MVGIERAVGIMTPSPKIATHSQSMYQSSKKSFRHTFNAKLMEFGFLGKSKLFICEKNGYKSNKSIGLTIYSCQKKLKTRFGTDQSDLQPKNFADVSGIQCHSQQVGTDKKYGRPFYQFQPAVHSLLSKPFMYFSKCSSEPHFWL